MLRALKFAKSAHAGQMRTSGEPFYTHLVAVCDLLRDIGADEETLVAALLHDSIEDTSVTAAQLKKHFGPVVTNLVEGVTKVQQLEKTFDKQTRNMESVRKMFRTMGDDIRVLFIKLADRLHNMQTLGAVAQEKQVRVARETKDIYCPLAKLLGMQEWYQELSDRCFQALDPREYEMTVRKFTQTSRSQLKTMRNWMERLELFIKKNKVKSVSMELKRRNFSEVRAACVGQEDLLNHIETFNTVSLVIGDTENPYDVLGLVHRFSSPLPASIDDYIASPKVNGYQALHTTVVDSAGVPITVMIQTRYMYNAAWMGLTRVFSDKRKYVTPEWVEELISLDEKEASLQAFFGRVQSEIFGERNHVTVISGKTKKAIDLPQYASALDLAFYTGQETGKISVAAVINGKPSSLKQTLRDGDIVEFVSENRQSHRSAEDLYMIHTALAHSRLVEHLSAMPAKEQEKRGQTLLQQAFHMTMDPFFSIQWQKEVFASLKEEKLSLRAMGVGAMDPYRYLEEHGNPKDFFLLDPRCFHLPSGLLPGSVMRYVLRADKTDLMEGNVTGIQVGPDVIEVVKSSSVQKQKSRSFSKEIIPLKVQPDVVAHPFYFALRWNFEKDTNPLKDIGIIESFLDSPVHLLQFNPSSVVLGFRTDTLATLDSVYKHLWSLPHVLDIFRVTP